MNSQVQSEVETGEKVVIVGDMGVGKSSIVLRFVNNTFSENLKSTIGCDHYEKELDVAGAKLKLSIWDTAGQKHLRGLPSAYYKNARCVAIVFDITKRSSFDKLEYWKDEINNYADEHIPVIVIGNKADLAEKRVVTKEDAENFVKKYKYLMYFETSAKDDPEKKIDEAFKYIANSITDKKKVDGTTLKGSQLKDVNKKDVNIEGEKAPEAGSGCKC